MHIVFYSVVLNHHQAPVADALWELCGGDYTFVELSGLADTKGAASDYSRRPYLLRAWKSHEAYGRAMELARTADVCVFSGVDALPFERERMKLGLLSFDMGERWLKRGWKSLLSPNLLRWCIAYALGGWDRKPLYKLGCSAFCAEDQYRLHTFRDRCYKWGYFTSVEKSEVEASLDVSASDMTTLMWCSRYLKLKHPELPVLLAHRLKRKGYRFRLDMYGSGEEEPGTKRLARDLGLVDVVRFHGAVSNGQVLKAMAQSDIFLFTSDRNEGWGAVANESMSNGCALVASDAIGSAPYLIEDGETGLMFKGPRTSSSIRNPDIVSLDELCEKIEYLLDNPETMRQIRGNARKLMLDVWSPSNAARSLFQLANDLLSGRDTSLTGGPCSKAMPL